MLYCAVAGNISHSRKAVEWQDWSVMLVNVPGGVENELYQFFDVSRPRHALETPYDHFLHDIYKYHYDRYYFVCSFISPIQRGSYNKRVMPIIFTRSEYFCQIFCKSLVVLNAYYSQNCTSVMCQGLTCMHC